MDKKTAWIRCVLLSGACALLGACGGDSGTSDSERGNEAGAENAGAGSAGVSGGGTSGGATSGGATSGGATSGGATSGGSGGEAAAGTMTGGAGAGGAATGGAGAGGAPSTDTCQRYCDNAVAAGCDSPASEGECLVMCSVLTGIEACASEVISALECDSTATTSCNAEGEVAFAGCEARELAVLVCLQNAQPPEALRGPCESYCAAVAAAACANDDPDSCLSECGAVGLLMPQCTESWATYVTCSGEETMTCNEDGEAEASACVAQGLVAATCLLSAVGGP